MSSSCVGLRNEPIYLHNVNHSRFGGGGVGGGQGGIALLNKKTIGNAFS